MISKKVFLVLFMSFITLLTWVVFDLLHSRAEVQPTPQVEPLLEPISPNFDLKGLDQL